MSKLEMMPKFPIMVLAEFFRAVEIAAPNLRKIFDNYQNQRKKEAKISA